MKLQLSVFAQDLVAVVNDDDGCCCCNPFAVISEIHNDPKNDQNNQNNQQKQKAPTVIIGKTEILHNTTNPDFTKIFIIKYKLGKPKHILVTICNQDDDGNNNKSLGSAIFEVGSVLATKGCCVGKEINSSGSIIFANIERSSGKGTLNFQMRGINLQSKQNQIDPLYELQRKRQTINTGDIVWDTVYRSRPVLNNSNPIWDDCCIELSTLVGGGKKNKQQQQRQQKFRVAIKDYDHIGNGKQNTIIGYFRISITELLTKVTQSSDNNTTDDEIDMDNNAIVVVKGKDKKEVGHVIIMSASIDDEEQEEGKKSIQKTTTSSSIVKEDRGDIYIPNNEKEAEVGILEEDIVIEATDDIELIPDDGDDVNFADYISGGCQLRVIVAIDFTASNGDPRKESSLHHFKKDGMNQYQTAMTMICGVLSEYDSDQKYPVWGFGAKRDGKLDQCFRCSLEEEEAEGVQGILDSYKNAFQSGIAMSSPTDITKVIRAAGKNARESLANGLKAGNQEYSILAIFTNGNVHDKEATIKAIEEAKDDPLSIVVIGVGADDFNDMAFLNDNKTMTNNRVHFVDMKSHQAEGNALTEETLKDIPQHLVDYFVGKGIKPNPPIPPDDIVISPFNEGDEVHADVVVTESGQIQVNSDAKPPDEKPGMVSSLSDKAKDEMSKQGKRILGRQKRQFGKIAKKMQRDFDRMVDQQMKKAFKF